MFGSPYSTTIGSKFKLQPVELALQKADIMKKLRVVDESKPWLLAVVDDPSLPVFVHPIIIDDKNRGRKVVVDLRQYTRNVQDMGTYLKIAPYGGAAITVNRAILQYYWSEETAESIFGLSNLPLCIYSRWLSEQIIRGLSVEPAHHLQLRVVAAYFYMAQFEKDGVLQQTDAQRLANKVAKATGVSASLVLEYIPKTIPNNIPELVALLSNGDYGMRLEELNVGTFLQVTCKGFFGVFRPDEVLAIGIEYPPTFIAVAYAVVNDRGYNRTPLQVAAKPFDRDGAFAEFNRAFDNFEGPGEVA